MRRALITVLTLLAVSWTGRLAGQVAIRSIRLTLDPVTYSGPCPVRLRAHVVFESNYPARVDEDDWGWNFGRLAPHSWDVPGGHLRTSGRETAVDTTLTIPHAGESGGLVHEGSVFVIMSLNPTISNKVPYSVHCSPAVMIDPKLVRPLPAGPALTLKPVPTIPPPAKGGAGPVLRLPDLVVSRVDAFAGSVTVTNTGDGAAAPSQLLLRILCVADTGVAERCSIGAVATMAPLSVPSDPSLGGLILAFPALGPGASHTIAVGGWSSLGWRRGKYEIEATADIRGAVAERNEANNVARVRITKP